MTRRRLCAAVALLAASAAALAGCAGVPTHSSPQTIESFAPGARSTDGSIAPRPGAAPRTIVQDFLRASGASGPGDGPRSFLTSAARNRWSQQTATVLSDESVGTYDDIRHTLVVTGRQLGTLNADGIYTPSLQGTGDGGAPVRFSFQVARVDGQYRIDNLASGLLITQQDFQSNYRMQNLYFYDVADRYLVPDPRYTAITARAQLADWLLTQLANGPRQELQSAVTTDTLPNQADSRHISVELGKIATVDIPGAAQLDGGSRNRLAAQLSNTLNNATSGGPMRIVDGSTRVTVPELRGTEFTAQTFNAALGPTALVSPQVFYLDDHHVVDENGRPLDGSLGHGYALESVAVRDASGALQFAAVRGTGTDAQLYVGSQHDGLHATALRGPLTRPAFVPGVSEAWVGAGRSVWRVALTGDASRPGPVSPVPLGSVAGGGAIKAVRISPDGSRLAVVVAGANGSSQLYVGAVTRASGQVRVDRLDPVSPIGVKVTDVAWLDTSKLYGIGSIASSGDTRSFETQSDGSDWTMRGLPGLPGAPSSVTAAPSALAWVSASSSVWVQNGGLWVTVSDKGQTPGLAPVYAEP